MNYNLIVDTDTLKETVQSILNTNDEMMSSISYLEDVLTELPNCFAGPIADAYVESVFTYLERIKQIYAVNDELANTIALISNEYEDRDLEYSNMSIEME